MKSFSSELEIDALLRKSMERTSAVLQADRSTLFLVDPQDPGVRRSRPGRLAGGGSGQLRRGVALASIDSDSMLHRVTAWAAHAHDDSASAARAGAEAGRPS